MNLVNLCFSKVQPNTIRYREYNRQKYLQRPRITCECGIEMVSGYMEKHIHTKKHQDYLKRIDKDDVDKRRLLGGDEEPTSEVS